MTNNSVLTCKRFKWHHLFAILTLLLSVNSDYNHLTTVQKETVELQIKPSSSFGIIFLYRKALLPEKSRFLKLSQKEIIASQYWCHLISACQKSLVKKRNDIKHKRYINYSTLFVDHLKLYS
ncbi:MAG: hypothetical protein CL613_03025 [Aquimarina sp.]|nr:hypothetical protein [Aquimarina sp.]